MIRLGTMILAAGVLAAAPLHAQSHTQHQHGQAHGQQAAHGEHAQGEHGMKCDHDDAVHRYAPKKLLEHRAMLQLTAQQVEKLEALHKAHETDCHAGMERIHAAEAAAKAALELPTPDVATFAAKSREAANLKIDCKVDMVKKGQEAVGLLTPSQRTHLAHMAQGGHH